jgi:cobalamin biosynthesis protein CobT
MANRVKRIRLTPLKTEELEDELSADDQTHEADGNGAAEATDEIEESQEDVLEEEDDDDAAESESEAARAERKRREKEAKKEKKRRKKEEERREAESPAAEGQAMAEPQSAVDHSVSIRLRILSLMRQYVREYGHLPRRVHVDPLSEVDFYALTPDEIGEKFLAKVSGEGAREAITRRFLGLHVVWDADRLKVD